MNIVITGASRGIGFEVARLFAARENNNIVAIARSEQKLKDLKNACIKENIQAHLYPIVFDLEQTDQIGKTLIPHIKQHIG
ncbi:MAG TPA: SDR family NAD(P)-dependent oxidoreductase, partial [Tenuifilaceae bacterium]|nr:SDR family NAD(P)-dependent oxidoreductase [Tenuifilaceae bacterium]